MPHFSRLTDIITCNLTEILDTADDPAATLQEVLDEMEEGLAGARRSARTAAANRDRLQKEIEEHTRQVSVWHDQARTALTAGDESTARDAMTRRVEIEDLLEGLLPELEAAAATHKHMLRIQKALEARHSEAVRRLTEVTGTATAAGRESQIATQTAAQAQLERSSEVEARLEALRRELNAG